VVPVGTGVKFPLTFMWANSRRREVGRGARHRFSGDVCLKRKVAKRSEGGLPKERRRYEQCAKEKNLSKGVQQSGRTNPDQEFLAVDPSKVNFSG